MLRDEIVPRVPADRGSWDPGAHAAPASQQAQRPAIVTWMKMISGVFQLRATGRPRSLGRFTDALIHEPFQFCS